VTLVEMDNAAQIALSMVSGILVMISREGPETGSPARKIAKTYVTATMGAITGHGSQQIRIAF